MPAQVAARCAEAVASRILRQETPETTHAVLDGPRAIHLRQAAYRLWAQQAILEWIWELPGADTTGIGITEHEDSPAPDSRPMGGA